MKVGIHNEPAGGALGGSEYCVAVLSAALAKQHDVDILHHRSNLTLEALATHFCVDLAGVNLRVVPSESLRRYPPASAVHRKSKHGRDITSDYDLFITFTHGLPPFCRARAGAIVVLFPFGEPTKETLTSNVHQTWKGVVRRRVALLWRRRQWRKLLNGYSAVASISGFTQHWTKRRWRLDSTVVYPPVDTQFEAANKLDAIVSVGRFAVEGHGKKQLEMIAAFGQLRNDGYDSWTYRSAGACGNSEKEQCYLQQVRQAAGIGGVEVLVNLERHRLRSIYQEAKIFWHAAGLGSDDKANPELAEHFGIATVEAMAAGCVPVVINKGAQPELVEHGVSGFLWDTVEELRQYTIRLRDDPKLLQIMSVRARERAGLFNQETYVQALAALLKPFLHNGAVA